MTIKAQSRFGNPAAILILAIAICLPTAFIHAAEEETLPVAINLEDVQWGRTGGGNGSPLGLRTSRQGIDPVTEGVTYYAMFPAGTHFDLHWHTHDEFVSVQKGSVVLELGDETFTLHPGRHVGRSGDVVAG